MLCGKAFIAVLHKLPKEKQCHKFSKPQQIYAPWTVALCCEVEAAIVE